MTRRARRLQRKVFSGAELERRAAHRTFPGNRPSTTLIHDRLTPRRLGQIIALYEHRVFVEGVILGLNSFDQWGVELGKELAGEIAPVLDGKAGVEEIRDSSTRQLIDFVKGTTRGLRRLSPRADAAPARSTRHPPASGTGSSPG